MLLLELLMIPAFIRTDCGFVVSGREGLCVLLYRLAFPTRLKDMRLVFGMSESRICETFNWMLHFVDYKWGFLLETGRGPDQAATVRVCRSCVQLRFTSDLLLGLHRWYREGDCKVGLSSIGNYSVFMLDRYRYSTVPCSGPVPNNHRSAVHILSSASRSAEV